jgi:2-polyprenyl-6-methoxyphenol hydroxylase-like FAD-dependent oxidoreductase
VTIRNRAEATAFEQDEHGVTVQARDLDGGAPIEVRARFLIGCDGGRSTVRKAIGATFVARR